MRHGDNSRTFDLSCVEVVMAFEAWAHGVVEVDSFKLWKICVVCNLSFLVLISFQIYKGVMQYVFVNLGRKGHFEV